MSGGRLQSSERVLALHHGTFLWRAPRASDVLVSFDRADTAVAWIRRGSVDVGGRQALRAALDSLGGSVDLGRVGAPDLEGRLGVALARHRILAVRSAETHVGAELPEVVEVVARAQEIVSERPEDLFNPRWSEPRVPIGRPVKAIVSHYDVVAPIAAVFVISEVDGVAREEVARVSTTIPAGTGNHEITWRRDPDAAQADLEHDEDAGEGGPLEYRFQVEPSRLKCDGESGPLWLTNTVEVDVTKELDGSTLPYQRLVTLIDAIGDRQRKPARGAKVTFDQVLVGPIEIDVDPIRFSDLHWSAARVPVGEPADAIFRYADAVAGTEALVVVYEVNRDGAEDEVERLSVTLDAERGEGQVTFTRSGEDAQRDVEDDEEEGDTGPVEYRFRVYAEGVRSRQSDALWLLHTVTVRVEDTAKKPDARPLDVLLVAADGAAHRAPLTGGRATFADVVCGPMVVRVLPGGG